MSRFFFDRRASEPLAEPSPPQPRTDERAIKALMEVQSITASAIFAALVSKGVLTAGEAAAHMAEIAEVLDEEEIRALAAYFARLRPPLDSINRPIPVEPVLRGAPSSAPRS